MPTALWVAYARMLGTTTALPSRMRPSVVSSAGNGKVAVSRRSLSNGQKAGFAVSSARSGRPGGWSFTPVRIRALAPVSGSCRQRSRTRAQAPPAARSGTLASSSRSSKLIGVTMNDRSGPGAGEKGARQNPPAPPAGARSGAVRAERRGDLLDGLCLSRAHALSVLPVGGSDLVGEGEDEAAVVVAFLGGRLALEQRHGVAQMREPVIPELLRGVVQRVIRLGLGRHDLVEELALAVLATRLGVGL